MKNDNGQTIGFVCNVGGHHAKDGELYLWPLDLKLKVIGKPKRVYGAWEHAVKCPECGQPAKALEGYMFTFNEASVKCKHCGFYINMA